MVVVVLLTSAQSHSYQGKKALLVVPFVALVEENVERLKRNRAAAQAHAAMLPAH